MSALSERLKLLRGSRTQRHLAEEFGVSAPLVSSWENGAAIPPIARLQQYILLSADLDAIGQATLMAELLAERDLVLPTPTVPEETLLMVLQDVRWLLVQIRERLPPL